VARYRVIFRACEATVAYNGKPRPFGLDKRTLVKLSFLSLRRSLTALPHEIHVVGDRLSDDLVGFFTGLGASLTNEELGNAKSLAASLARAFDTADGTWVYLCEDDYLHVPDAFARVDELIEHRAAYLGYRPRSYWRRFRVGAMERKPLCLFLADYPDYYRPKHTAPSLIFRSGTCHWRQVLRTTWSFVAEPGYLRRKRDALLEIAKTCDDRALSGTLYGDRTFRGRALCLAPIPGLASHMHEGTMGVFGDWQTLTDRLRGELAALEGTPASDAARRIGRAS
jgi:hypothetical protein